MKLTCVHFGQLLSYVPSLISFDSLVSVLICRDEENFSALRSVLAGTKQEFSSQREYASLRKRRVDGLCVVWASTAFAFLQNLRFRHEFILSLVSRVSPR